MKCQHQVVGYKGNVHKSYKVIDKAWKAWIFYAPRWKREELTCIELEEQVNHHNATATNIEINEKRERRNGFNFFTTFCIGCVSTLVIVWIIPRIMYAL